MTGMDSSCACICSADSADNAAMHVVLAIWKIRMLQACTLNQNTSALPRGLQVKEISKNLVIRGRVSLVSLTSRIRGYHAIGDDRTCDASGRDNSTREPRKYGEVDLRNQGSRSYADCLLGAADRGARDGVSKLQQCTDAQLWPYAVTAWARQSKFCFHICVCGTVRGVCWNR